MAKMTNKTMYQTTRNCFASRLHKVASSCLRGDQNMRLCRIPYYLCAVLFVAAVVLKACSGLTRTTHAVTPSNGRSNENEKKEGKATEEHKASAEPRLAREKYDIPSETASIPQCSLERGRVSIVRRSYAFVTGSRSHRALATIVHSRTHKDNARSLADSIFNKAAHSLNQRPASPSLMPKGTTPKDRKSYLGSSPLRTLPRLLAHEKEERQR